MPRPNKEQLVAFLATLSTQQLGYGEQKKVKGNIYPEGYDHDRNEALIGQGREAFLNAKSAIQNFHHFPQKWAFAVADGAPTIGQNVGVFFYQFFCWWWNGSRVMEIFDEPDYYGFSYGTLKNHVELGEELFYTRINSKGEVFYGIHAYSKPRFWGARLLKPYARSQQARFVRDSIQTMKKRCANE